MIQETDYIKMKTNLNYFLTCNSYLRWECDDADRTLQMETDLFEKGQPVIFTPCCI